MGSIENQDSVLKLVLVGDAGVGKSCLVTRYTEDKFEQSNSSTIGVDFMIKFLRVKGERIKLEIWDTAGNERFRSLTRAYYRDTHGILFVYDVSRSQTLKDLESIWMPEVESNTTFESAVKTVIGNKVDLEQREVSTEEGMDFAKEHGCLFMETSARSDLAVAQAFGELVEVIRHVPELMQNARRPTEKLIKKDICSTRSCCS